jgi:hypothetical protein
MKTYVLLVVFTCLIGYTGYSQEEPIPPKRSHAVKIGALGGFTPGWLSVDVGPINDFLSAGKGAPLNNNGVVLYGGAGAAYILLVPNLRVGGMGMGGSIESTSLDALGIRRDAKLHVAFGGVTVEYVIPLIEHLDLAAGAMIGTGGIDIILRQNNGGFDDWLTEQRYLGTGLGAPTNNVSRKLTGSYFVWVPAVNIEYGILGWLGVRLGASYVGMSAPSWTVDDQYDLLGVPSKVSGKGFMVNMGIFIGTFY